MAAKVQPEASASATSSQGDIVSEYPKLVFTFVALQFVCWTLSLVEAAGLMGPVAFAFNTQAGVVDFNLCMMMFFGTLHNGLLSDKRLSLICRAAFVVDGFAYFLTYGFVFRPESLEQLVNYTLTGERTAESIISGFISASIWLFMLTIVSSWFGILMLELGRRRLFEHAEKSGISLATFSNMYLNYSTVMLTIQVVVMAFVMTATAAAQTDVARFHATTMVSASFNFTSSIAQLVGYKVMLFNAGLERWGWSGWLGALFVVLFGLLATFHFLCALFWNGGVGFFAEAYEVMNSSYAALSCMVFAWIFISISFGVTRKHLCNMDAAEERRKLRQQGEAKRDALEA